MNFNVKRLDGVSILIILAVFAASIPLIYAGVTVDISEKNISDNDPTTSNAQGPQMAVNGSIVYIVWYNGTDGFTCASSSKMCNITLAKSTDNGTTFSTPIIIGNSTTADPTLQIAIGSGNNVYVVWQNGTDIEFVASSDGGTSFTTTKPALGTTNVAPIVGKPQIVTNSSGNNVYVAWINQTKYVIRSSDDDGATFLANFTIGDHGEGSSRRSISLAVSNDTVYAVMQDGKKIDFKRSTNNGTTFVDPTTPGNEIGNSHPSFTTRNASPFVLANDTSVYVVWKDDEDIKFIKSSDSGDTFGTEIDVGDVKDLGSNDPKTKIANGTGGRLFIVWEDDVPAPDEIKMANSTDSGASFGAGVTLSGTATAARDPQIVTVDNLVYIVWRQTLGGDEDIQFISSNNNGVDFGSATTLTTTTHDISPQLGASNDKAFIFWESHPTTLETEDGEVNFSALTASTITITFNATQYKTFNSATITVTDADSNTAAGSTQSINVALTSSTDGDGITLSFVETDVDTGIFADTITFSESLDSSATDKRLKISPGDTITGTFDNVSGSSSIFTRTVEFDSTSYLYTAKPSVKVTDQNSNTDSSTKETVVVTITSAQTEDSKTLTLTETEIDSGIFGTFATNDLILTNGSALIPLGSTLTITETITTANSPDTEAIDTITNTVTTTTTPGGVSVTLTETGVNTNIYTGKIGFNTEPSGGGTISSAECDEVNVSSSASPTPLVSTALITPCSTLTLNALSVSVTDSATDTLTASYQGATDTASVTFASGEEGGGGGGLVRPSLVLDILAGASSVFGGGGGSAAPVLSLKVLRESSFIAMPDEIEQIIINFDPFTPLEPLDVNAEEFETFDFPLSIDNDGYAISGYSNTLDTKILNTGEATKIKAVFYMPFELEHVAFYTNIRKGDSLDDSDAFLRFYKSKPDQNQVKDENGFFEYIKLTIEEDGIKKTAIFDMKFQNPMPKSDIVLRMWDEDLHSTTVLIFDAIEVVGPSLEPIEEAAPEDLEISEPGTTVPEISELRIEEHSTDVPDWIKTNAKWWNEGYITDTDFKSGIEFLIKNNVMKLPQSVLEKDEQLVQNMPHWLKFNAAWWGDGLLTDQEFVNGIKWLYENGIITIRPIP